MTMQDAKDHEGPLVNLNALSDSPLCIENVVFRRVPVGFIEKAQALHK